MTAQIATGTAPTPITATMVQALRESTGAPLMRCKAALVAADGDFTRAKTVLREQGVKATPVQREGNQGYLAVYTHQGNQIVALVELACSTDFVARSEEFRKVATELAMQVAATAPMAVSLEDIPIDVREAELQIARAQIDADPKMAGKPEALKAQVAEAKAVKVIEEKCLLTQASIRDAKVKIGALIEDLKLKVREGVYVRRIARWRVGETL